MNNNQIPIELIENPLVYYIYNLGFPIFDISGDNFYIIITADNYTLNPSDFTFKCKIFKMSKWFKMVEECSIIPWMCACLNRKFIIKEHVKLLMTTNPVKIRLFVQNNNYLNHPDTPKEACICNTVLRLYNQILENHKIVNYKCIKKLYEAILGASRDNWKEISFSYYKPEFDAFIKATDGIYMKYKVAQWELNKQDDGNENN